MQERLSQNGHLPDVKVFGPDGRLVKVDEIQLVGLSIRAVTDKEPVRVWGSRDTKDNNELLIEELERFFESREATARLVRVIEEEEGSPWLLIVTKS